jgi:hypothetical protein
MKITGNNSDNFFLNIWNNTIGRIILFFLTAVLFLLFLISVLANPVLNWVVKPKIINSVNNESVNLQIAGIDFSLFQNRIIIYNSVLTINDSANNNRINIPYISANRINWFTLLFKDGYKFGNVIISEPKIFLKNYSLNNSKRVSGQDTSYSSDSTLAQHLAKLIPEGLNPLILDNLKINSATLIHQSFKEKEIQTAYSIKNISVAFSDIYLDNIINKSPIGSFELSIQDFHQRISQPAYDFKISSIEISSRSADLSINDLTYKPYIPDKIFFKGNKYRSDRWIIKIPKIVLNEADWIKFFNENLLSVNTISVPKFHIEIFTNRRLSLDPATKPEMPHELITALGFNLEAEKFQTENSLIILESVMPEVERRAYLEFTNVKAAILNISNTKRKQTNKTPSIIEASGKLQDQGLIKIKLKYNLLSDHLNFNYEGSLSEMDATLLNSHLEVEDKSKIESGKILTSNFSANINYGISSVNIIPLYNNLKIKILNEESNKKKPLMTLIANVKIRESNPDEDGKIKSANVSYPKKATDTFMDVIWLAILKGLSEVVGF